MDEQELLEKLKLIGALWAGATTPGERNAAFNAAQRVQARIDAAQKEASQEEEYQFSMIDGWSRKLFVAMARRHGLEPYRYPRQRRTTVMLRVEKQFLDQTLWPEFKELDDTLCEYLSAVTDRVIANTVKADSSEAEVRQETLLLEK
ncbi:MAG: hypothetical protein GXP24_08535 [Planctomycetes bacterium]|nr:hypothetical protein [Planctomycetota bacterium]